MDVIFCLTDYLPGNMDDIQPGLGQCTAKIRWSADPIKAQAQNLQHPSSLELKRSKKILFPFLICFT
jgi:hypothetical protein